MQIFDLLNVGEGNALTEKYLTSITGLSGKQIRVEIHRERLDGVPILSNGRGYYLAQNEHEKRVFVRGMRHRAEQILRAARGVELGRKV